MKRNTPGSVSVATADGDGMVGDLMSGGIFVSGRPHLPFFADDLALLRESIKLVLGLPARRLYCAHYGPLEAGAVKRWLEG